MKKLILASGSPRRKELLEQVNVHFNIEVSDIVEEVPIGANPEDVVTSLAVQKAQAIAEKFPDDLILGADTIVTYEGKILGKPKGIEDAKEMLTMLSGKEHIVMTGVAIIQGSNVTKFYEATNVSFWELTDQEINDYIASGEPFDKAGAYGIQGLGATLVKRIEGDYFSVVGLPLARVIRELRKITNDKGETI